MTCRYELDPESPIATVGPLISFPPRSSTLQSLVLSILVSTLSLIAAWAETPSAERKDRSVVTEEDRQFWSFRPVATPPVPLSDDPWVRRPLDGFILSKIREADQQPAAETSKRLWLRRVSFDLIGLPPTPEEIRAFEANAALDAYPHEVDRLLASPRYGERWASHWLDGVRYVEETGYHNLDTLGWRYRDWVIRSLNTDLPYNEFIKHQIAGDLLPNPTDHKVYPDGLIATGFLCMGNYDDQDSEKDRLYADVADDIVDTISRQFLGLTVACARCHDHKFDPIPTRDYYALAGIFMSTRVLGTESRIGAKRIRVPIHRADSPRRQAEREQERRDLQARLSKLDQSNPIDKGIHEALTNHLKRLDEQKGMAMAAQEGGYSNSFHKEIGDMPLYIRGDHTNHGPPVPRGVLQVVAGKHARPIGERTKQSGRLELAEWIADSENPLTARVMVNRLWLHHFGEGLVRTPSNFGALGDRPTHPLLLDWLASHFVASGWSLKALHREMVLSATYRQQSNVAISIEVDPENKLFARFDRRRLEAEQIHDTLLFVSGRLRPDATYGLGARAVYQQTGHLRPWAFGELFDSPPAGTMLAQRQQSTSTPQSLFLLNNESAIAAAKALAARFASGDQELLEQITTTYALLFSRAPTEEELSWGTSYLQSTDKPWTFFQVLLCSNELLHIE